MKKIVIIPISHISLINENLIRWIDSILIDSESIIDLIIAVKDNKYYRNIKLPFIKDEVKKVITYYFPESNIIFYDSIEDLEKKVHILYNIKNNSEKLNDDVFYAFATQTAFDSFKTKLNKVHIDLGSKLITIEDVCKNFKYKSRDFIEGVIYGVTKKITSFSIVYSSVGIIVTNPSRTRIWLSEISPDKYTIPFGFTNHVDNSLIDTTIRVLKLYDLFNYYEPNSIKYSFTKKYVQKNHTLGGESIMCNVYEASVLSHDVTGGIWFGIDYLLEDKEIINQIAEEDQEILFKALKLIKREIEINGVF